MAAKSQPHSQPTSRQRRTPPRNFIIVIFSLSLLVLILPSLYVYGSTASLGSLFDDIKLSIRQGGLGQTTVAIGVAFKQVLSEVQIYISDIAYWQSDDSESKRSKRQAGGSAPGLTGGGASAGSGSATGSGGLSGDNPLSELLAALKNDPGGAANALGAGLSDGAIKGLKLNEMMSMGPITEPAHENDAEKVAWNLGEGASEAFTSKIDLMSVAPLDQIGPVALAFGSGLGDGMMDGLHLSNAGVPNSTNATMAVEVTGNLGYGLTNAIFGHISSPQSVELMRQLAKIPGPAGKGLGQGAAIGLKLAPPVAEPSGNGTFDAASASEDFTRNLASSFLESAATSLQAGQQQLLAALGQAAPFAGAGLGEGAAEGLGFTPAPSEVTGLIKRQQQPAPANISSIAKDFTRALSFSFLSTANASALLALQEQAVIGPAVLGLGEGLGHGAAAALHLQDDPPAPVNASDTGSITRGLSFSFVTSFLDNETLTNVGKMVAQQPPIPMVPAMQGLGRGFGYGAAAGLGLQPDMPPPASATDVPSILQGFSDALTTSFLANDSLQRLQQILLRQKPVLAAEGLGRGFGGGAAALFGVTDPGPDPNASDLPSILQGLSQSMTASFLSPEVIGKLQAIVTQIIPASLNISSIAQGLAIGLVDGGSKVVFDQTGLGNGSLSTTFNDSVDGAATGFGRGLGFEGAKVVFMALGNDDVAQNVSSLVDGSPIDAAALATTTPPSKRGDTIQVMALTPRAPPTNTTDPMSGLLQNLNMTTVNCAAQKAIDALGCTGTGGLIQVLLGLSTNLDLKPPSLAPLPTTTTTLNLTQNNHLIQLTLPATLTINHLPARKYLSLLLAHIITATTLHLALPAALLLHTLRSLATRLHHPTRLASPSVSTLLAASLPLLAATTAALGAALSPTRPRSAHAVLGWLVLAGTVVGAVAGAVRRWGWGRWGGNAWARRAGRALAGGLVVAVGAQMVLGVGAVGGATFCATQAVPVPLAVAAGVGVGAGGWVVVGAVVVGWVVGRWVEKGGEGGGDGEGEVVVAKEESGGRAVVGGDGGGSVQQPFSPQLPPRYESGGGVRWKLVPSLRSRFSGD
ncbi:uncharacterized protein LTHEOB_1740 [Neofusicoccum parvum]|nr:uncharacterized protein LTHEOB_1740 [Neofusicoccum parvum]